jgi:YidC/Oxa1 family membrane protein insertase
VMLQRCAKSITSASIKSSRLSATTFTNTGKRCPYAFNKYSRCFSASPTVGNASDKAAAIAEAASSISQGASDSLPATVIDSVTQVDEAAAVIGFSPSQVIMQIIDQVHLLVGIPYWEAIILTTLGLRVVMLPMAISSVQNAAKMGALRPAIQAIKDRQAKHPSGDDPSIRSRFEAETKQLFLSHKVNPLKSIAMPLIQLPIFLSLYFALRDMGIYFPEYSTGGEFWFSDLTAADQYYIFPVVNALSFLVMIELGADGIQTENQGMFKWVRFTFCSARMKPLCDWE